MTKDAKSVPDIDKEKTFWRILADLIVGGLTPQIRDHVSAALDAVNGKEPVTASWKPEMYCAKPPEIVAACASGHHDWVDDHEDACVHCVLDLTEYVPKLHAELAHAQKVLDVTMRERERTGAELSVALDRAKADTKHYYKLQCDRVLETAQVRKELVSMTAALGETKLFVEQLDTAREEAIRLLRKARTLLMRTASSTDRSGPRVECITLIDDFLGDKKDVEELPKSQAPNLVSGNGSVDAPHKGPPVTPGGETLGDKSTSTPLWLCDVNGCQRLGWSLGRCVDHHWCKAEGCKVVMKRGDDTTGFCSCHVSISKCITSEKANNVDEEEMKLCLTCKHPAYEHADYAGQCYHWPNTHVPQCDCSVYHPDPKALTKPEKPGESLSRKLDEMEKPLYPRSSSRPGLPPGQDEADALYEQIIDRHLSPKDKTAFLRTALTAAERRGIDRGLKRAIEMIRQWDARKKTVQYTNMDGDLCTETQTGGPLSGWQVIKGLEELVNAFAEQKESSVVQGGNGAYGDYGKVS